EVETGSRQENASKYKSGARSDSIGTEKAPAVTQVRTRTMTQQTNMSDSGSGRAAQSMMPAVLLGMAAFLTNFDVTAVVIALPAVARELGFDVAGYAWVMDAYSLAFTACLLFAGALAGRY